MQLAALQVEGTSDSAQFEKSPQLMRGPFGWLQIGEPMRFKVLVLTCAVCVPACSSPFGPDEARALAAARARWEGRAFPDYTFDAQHGCFCPPEQVGPVRITVQQGAIASVTLLQTGEAIDAASWFTIDQLFDRIPLMAKEDGVDDVVVDYDATLGFPASVEVRFEKGNLDAGSHYTVSAVAPVQ
jgi:hypothetical protein